VDIPGGARETLEELGIEIECVITEIAAMYADPRRVILNTTKSAALRHSFAGNHILIIDGNN
jgi:8-oxo-dGTP pyrophosphatase MutT (NUDIX family)